MAIETKEKVINGHKWEVSQWPAREALRMKIRLGKTIGPALGKALSAGDLDSELSDMKLDGIIEALVDRLDETASVQMVLDMLSQTLVDGKHVGKDSVFDDHFTSNFGELYQGLAFVLEVNFGGFMQAAASITGRPQKPDESENQGEAQAS